MSLSKIQGCLIGGASGDALGYAVEFCGWNEIRKLYGANGIQHYSWWNKGEEWDGIARFSDDTQMTLFTAEGILVSRKSPEKTLNDCIYRAYLHWLMTQGRGTRPTDAKGLLAVPALWHRRAPGMTCIGTLASGKCGTRSEPLNDSKGCGGIMRTAPLGCAFPRADEKEIIGYGADAAAITHSHPLGYISAGLLSSVVHRLVFGKETTVKAAVLGAVEDGRAVFDREAEKQYYPYQEELVRHAVELAEKGKRYDAQGDVDNIRKLGEGWVGEEALAIAVYATVRYEDDFSACIRAAANHSGDSDSTAAIAGNILGALCGLEGIESEWTRKLEIKPTILALGKLLAAE